MDGNDDPDQIDMEDDFDDFDDLEILDEESANPVLEKIQETMDTFLASASVDAVYGEPVTQQDTLIIPAAEVVAVMGFGIGSGEGGDQEDSGSGSGGGGGGRVFARPVAVIIAAPEGVRVEPVVDITKIAMAGLTALAFLFGLRARWRSMRRALEDVE